MPIGPPIPEITHFQNLTSKIQGQGQMSMMLHNYMSRQFHRTTNDINPSSSFRYRFRKVWPKCCLIWQVFGPWTSPYGANGQITMIAHNYKTRQVHKTWNGLNPYSSFRDMRSAKSGPYLWQISQVFSPWANQYGTNGQMTMPVNNYRPRQFHRTSNGENPSSGYRYMGSANLAAGRPATRTVTTIPLQPGGLRGKIV